MSLLDVTLAQHEDTSRRTVLQQARTSQRAEAVDSVGLPRLQRRARRLEIRAARATSRAQRLTVRAQLATAATVRAPS